MRWSARAWSWGLWGACSLAAGACVPTPEPPVAGTTTGSTGVEVTGQPATATSVDTTGTTAAGHDASTGAAEASTGGSTGSSGSEGSTQGTTGESTGTGTDAGTDASTGEALAETPELSLLPAPIKRFDFSWVGVVGADDYQLEESTDPGAPLLPLGGPTTDLGISHEVPLHLRHQASYRLRACGMAGCLDSPIVDVTGTLADAVGYFKASIPLVGDQLGARVAISADGHTLAVAAITQDAGGLDSGAVYVFVRDDVGAWSQQAFLKASNIGLGDGFGSGLALSGDGDTLAVGAPSEDGASTGIGGDQASNAASGAGAVYVLVRDGAGAWSHEAYVKASNTGSGDAFGTSIALSGDGDTLVVGAPSEDGASTGIGGDQASNAASGAGAVYVLVRDGAGAWSHEAYLKASNTDAGDAFGIDLALASDGGTLVVGAYEEDSAAIGIDGIQGNDSSAGAGAAYVLVRDGAGAWSHEAYLKASNTDVGDWFGMHVAISSSGDTVAVGAFQEDGAATGIDGDATDDSAAAAGAAYVFQRSGAGAWSQAAYAKASNTGAGDYFGYDVALSGDGRVLAVGAIFEAGSAVGIGGDGADDSAASAGAVYAFVRDAAGAWVPRSYVKASNTDPGDVFGASVALDEDGQALAVGAYGEASHATGVGGDQADDSVGAAGAVYLY